MQYECNGSVFGEVVICAAECLLATLERDGSKNLKTEIRNRNRKVYDEALRGGNSLH